MTFKDIVNFTEAEWETMIKTTEMSLEFLTEHAPYIPDNTWTQIAKHQKLTEEFIIDFHYFLPISTLVSNQKVHQNVIEKNLEIFSKYMWHVCRYQYLTEQFMIKHMDIVHWKNIFKFQKHISISFIKNYFHKIPEEYIYNNGDFFSISVLKKHGNLIDNLVEKHNDKIRVLSAARGKRWR